MELVLWLSLINHYAHTMVQQSLRNRVVRGLLVTVYIRWGRSTQLAQYSNSMDVCMITQD